MVKLLLLNFISLFLISEAFAAKGLVIKLDIDDSSQKVVNGIRKKAQMQENPKPLHVTVLYLDMPFSDNYVDSVGKALTQSFEDVYKKSLHPLPVNFEVQDARQPFGNAISLMPSGNTERILKDINSNLIELVQDQGYQVGTLTTRERFTPHMTFSPNPNPTQFLAWLNTEIQTFKSQSGGTFSLKLAKFSYTVMK